MRWDKRKPRELRDVPEHRWFAWYPVEIDDGNVRRYAWLETVLRSGEALDLGDSHWLIRGWVMVWRYRPVRMRELPPIDMAIAKYVKPHAGPLVGDDVVEVQMDGCMGETEGQRKAGYVVDRGWYRYVNGFTGTKQASERVTEGGLTYLAYDMIEVLWEDGSKGLRPAGEFTLDSEGLSEGPWTRRH